MSKDKMNRKTKELFFIPRNSFNKSGSRHGNTMDEFYELY